MKEKYRWLAGWWQVTGADLVWEKNTAGWLADKPNEQSEIYIYLSMN